MATIHLPNTKKGTSMESNNLMAILAGYFWLLFHLANSEVLAILTGLAAISTIVMNIVKYFRERPRKIKFKRRDKND